MEDDEEVFEGDPSDPWTFSLARELLVKDIKDGAVGIGQLAFHASQVYVRRLEYAEYDYDEFARYYSQLRAKYDQLHYLAHIDSQSLAHDLTLGLRTNNKPYTIWQGSDAEKALKEDMEKGLHLAMKPRELIKTRPEYAPWANHLSVFRDHIHQAKREVLERPYWMARKKLKEDAKHKAGLEKARAAAIKKQKAAEKAAEKAQKAAEKAVKAAEKAAAGKQKKAATK